jgi:aryl-alcohol dehydrogenase-like predicted oxidoreductase
VELRPLGTTGLRVSAVGLGAGRIGDADTSDADVDALVGAALDLGVTLVDTAPSYGLSEERLGRALAGRRDRVVLSTKLGYGVPGIPDWTGPCITAGVEAALSRLRTDRIDVAHLHSCGLDLLVRGELVEALHRAVASGKVRVAAYSGEDEPLLWAVRSGAFGAVQCSVSVVDQGPLPVAVAEAASRGLGVLGKRPLGNAPWRFRDRPSEADVAEAWQRFQALALPPHPLGWTDLFARFAAFAPGVSAILVGTSRPAHLAEVVASVERGPLDAPLGGALRSAFRRAGGSWNGRI